MQAICYVFCAILRFSIIDNSRDNFVIYEHLELQQKIKRFTIQLNRHANSENSQQQKPLVEPIIQFDQIERLCTITRQTPKQQASRWFHSSFFHVHYYLFGLLSANKPQCNSNAVSKDALVNSNTFKFSAPPIRSVQIRVQRVVFE